MTAAIKLSARELRDKILAGAVGRAGNEFDPFKRMDELRVPQIADDPPGLDDFCRLQWRLNQRGFEVNHTLLREAISLLPRSRGYVEFHYRREPPAAPPDRRDYVPTTVQAMRKGRVR